MFFYYRGPPSFVSSFLFADLLLPALVIFFLGFTISWKVTRAPHWAIFVAYTKTVVFLGYYGFFFDGTYTFLDDWTYLYGGELLLNKGVSLLNMFAHLPDLFLLAGGKHFIYYVLNADAFRLFGPGYYSPVALNIVLTFLAAAFMAAAAKRGLGFSRKLAAGFFICMVLHPDVVAWSTIMNGKDVLVLTGTALAVYAVSLAADGQHIRAVILAVMVGLVLFFTRFYIPLLLLCALFASLFLSSMGRRRPLLWLIVPVGLISLFVVLGPGGLADAFGLFQEGFVNPLYGVPRILLTPIPFNTADNYAFLDFPQLFHWTMMPALAYGCVRVWLRATLTARFLVIYFLLTLFLYGMFDHLQGPRHRVQLDGLIALFQFYGGVDILKQMLGRQSRRVVHSTQVARSSVGGV